MLDLFADTLSENLEKQFNTFVPLEQRYSKSDTVFQLKNDGGCSALEKLKCSRHVLL